MTDSSRSTGARTETISLGSARALVGGELVPGSVAAGRYEVRRRAFHLARELERAERLGVMTEKGG